MTGHVFISHASENQDAANEIVTLIEAKGITAWIAPRDVRPGYDYSEELQSALEKCAAFVVLVTDDANTSPYVRAETEMAFSCQKPMLPVRMSEIAPAPGLAFFLKIRHWTEAWGPKRDAALARLVLELQTLTGTAPSWAPRVGPAAPPQPPAPPPPPPPAPAAPPPLAAEATPAPPAGNSQRTIVWIVIIGFVLAAATAAILLLNRRDPRPSPPPLTTNSMALTPTPTPTPAAPARAYASELTDFGINSKSELEANVGSATPIDIPVGSRVTTEELQRLLAENRAIPIDVLVDAHPQTLPGALYMPAGGRAGTFDDINQTQFTLQLGQATGGDLTRPLVFFCAGVRCWESYNAALRANAAGYSQLYWFRGGLAAWQEAGLPMTVLPAPYGGATEAN